VRSFVCSFFVVCLYVCLFVCLHNKQKRHETKTETQTTIDPEAGKALSKGALADVLAKHVDVKKNVAVKFLDSLCAISAKASSTQLLRFLFAVLWISVLGSCACSLPRCQA
jgi:hypothetical protein